MSAMKCYEPKEHSDGFEQHRVNGGKISVGASFRQIQ